MARILFLLAGVAVLALPAAAAARPQSQPKPGYLVVRNASTDGGVKGSPVATIGVSGFVVGHVAEEGSVQFYRLLAGPGSLAAQVTGIYVQRRAVIYHSRDGDVGGFEYSGSDFRFRAVGGIWRVVVRGAGVHLYAGGVGSATLHGSRYNAVPDGHYSFDGKPFRSLPAGVVTQNLGHT
jgi:hypothetical protein